MASAPGGGVQAAADAGNAAFWDELCGTTLARAVGATDHSPESLTRFDAAYLEMYPYLLDYVPASFAGDPVLEIGLGYGTLGELLASRDADYHGLDIAEGPVAMMADRLSRLGLDDATDRVARDSALRIPHPDRAFKYVFSIGCLHHTGDLQAAVAEVHRVLEPGGTAVVMVYNRHSIRHLAAGVRARVGRDRGSEEMRRAYDPNSRGEAAPVTEFVSRREAAEIFSRFRETRVRSENFADFSLLRDHVRVPRTWFLGWPARVAGLDLYVVATR